MLVCSIEDNQRMLCHFSPVVLFLSGQVCIAPIHNNCYRMTLCREAILIETQHLHKQLLATEERKQFLLLAQKPPWRHVNGLLPRPDKQTNPSGQTNLFILDPFLHHPMLRSNFSVINIQPKSSSPAFPFLTFSVFNSLNEIPTVARNVPWGLKRTRGTVLTLQRHRGKFVFEISSEQKRELWLVPS